MRYRHLRRTAIAVPAGVACLLLALVVAQRIVSSAVVRHLTASWIERSVLRATDIELTIGSLGWSIVPPGLELAQVRLIGAGFAAEIDTLRIEGSRVALRRREIILDSVAVSGARVRTEGRPSAGVLGGAGRGWIRVTVRHLALKDLEFEGRQIAAGVDLDLRGVDAAWTDVGGPPRGWVRVGRAALVARGMEPVSLGLDARLRGGAGELLIERLRLRAEGLALEGNGRLGRDGQSWLRTAGWLDLAELDRVVRARADLGGRCRLELELEEQDGLRLTAGVDADRVTAAGFELSAVAGRLELSSNGLIGVIEHAMVCGGAVRGRYTLGGLRTTWDHRVELEADGFSLVELLEALRIPPGGLSATAVAIGELRWRGRDVPHGHGHAEVRLRPRGAGLPVEGTVGIELESDGLLRFAAESLRLGASVIDWQGPLTIGTWEPAWSVRALPARLDELIPQVNRWVGAEAIPEAIRGAGELQASLAGPFAALRVDLRLEATDVQYPPLRFDQVAIEATVSDGALEIQSARFRLGDGSGEVAGRLAWAPAAGEEQLDLELRGQSIPLAAVAAWLELEHPPTGRAAFTGGLRGPIAGPRGSWALGLTGVGAAGVELGDGSATVDLERGRFTARDLAFSGGLAGSVWWDVPGVVVGGVLTWPHLPLTGLPRTVTQLVGNAGDVVADLVWPLGDWPTGSVRLTSPQAAADLVLGRESIGGTLAVDGVGGARLTLDRGGDGTMAGPGEVWVDDVGELVERLLPQAGIPLTGSAHAELDARLGAEPGLPRLDGVLDRLEVRLDERPIELLEPAAFTVDRDAVALKGLFLRAENDEIFARCRIGADGSLSGNLSGTLDALLARFLLPEWQPSGRLSGVIEVLGTLDTPRFEGIAEASQLSFRLPASRQVLSGVSGTVLLSSEEALLDGIEFRLLQGSGRGGGRIARRGQRVELELAGTVSRLQLPLFPGFTPRLAGDWRLSGPVDDLELAGDVTVERASLRRREELTEILADWLSQPSAPDMGGGLKLDVHVEADRTLEARTPFLRLLGSASLDISGTTERPGVVGKVEFQEGGEITFRGVRYELERGSLTFSDPLRLEPFVDLQMRAWVESYQVMVGLSGTSDRLVPSIASDPPLPEAEVFALIALGRRGQTQDSETAGLGLASTLLTSELNAELDRRARSLLPVDQVRVDPFAEVSTGNPTARVTMVKQINPRWTVVVQGNLSANREEVVVSRWFLGPGLFIEASRDVDGTYALDLKVRRRY